MKNNNMFKKVKRETIWQLVVAGLLTAVGVILPQIFHMFGIAGNIFLPMHIPVLLCGMICGYRLGGVCGIIVPILSSLITGMPPIYPMGVWMAIELATYAIVAGLLIKKTNVFVSLIGAMLSGRLVFALVKSITLGIGGTPFVLGAYLADTFVTALPGIVIQIIAIPAIVIAVERMTHRSLQRASN